MGKVKIGHAVADENGKAKGGLAGDQTGKEVAVRNWYDRKEGWSALLRATDAEKAEKIAVAMEQACANDHIGYNQAQRTTLYAEAVKCGWDLSKITVDCDTDCSALVAVCVNCAGIEVNKAMYTGNELKLLKQTGAFRVWTDEKYLTKSESLRRGDILLGSGHTAIVLTDGENSTIGTIEAVKKPFTAFVVRVVQDTLNVYAKADVKSKVRQLVKKGDAYTIVDVVGHMGKLKSGAGWIDLNGCKTK